MKRLIAVPAILLLLAILAAGVSLAQKPDKAKPAHKAVVVKHKKVHSKKVAVYHPHWAPQKAYYRRWVYFPKYNFYWDNYRGVYVYRKGNVWVTSVGAPAVAINIDLSKEKQVELPEENDAVDEVYKNNDVHIKLGVRLR